MSYENIYTLEEEMNKDKLAFYKNINSADLLFKIKEWPKKPAFSRKVKFIEKAYNQCFDEKGDLIIDKLNYYFEDSFFCIIVKLDILKKIKTDYGEDVLYFMLYKNDNKLTYFDVLMFINDPMEMIKNAFKFKHRPSIVVKKWILTKKLVDCL